MQHLIPLTLIALLLIPLAADSSQTAALGDGTTPAVPIVAPSARGDQGDGTFKNPVLPADCSDIDVIRVGSDWRRCRRLLCTHQARP